MGTAGGPPLPPPPPPPPPVSEPAGGARGRSRIVVIAVVVVAVAALATATTVLVGTRGSDVPDVPVPAGFAQEPDVLWSITTADLASDTTSETVFATPQHLARTYGTLGAYVFDDTIVSTMFQYDDRSRDGLVVGINSATGESRWIRPFPQDGSCAPEQLDGDVICVTHDDGGSSTITGIDLESGDVDSEVTVDFRVGAMTVADGSLFVSGYESSKGDFTYRLARGDVDDPEGDWSQVFSSQDCFTGSGDYDALEVGNEQVAWYAAGVVVNARDGEVVIRGSRSELLGNGAAEVGRCEMPRDGGLTSDVVRPDGTTVGSWADSSVVDGRTPGVGAHVPIVLGSGESFDLDGSRRWYQPAILSSSRFVAVVGNVLVGNDIEGHAFGVSAETGDLLWRTDVPVIGESAPAASTRVDGDRVLFLADRTLMSVSTRDGSVEWSKEVETSGDDRTMTSGPTLVLLESSQGLTALVPPVDDESRR